MTKSSFVSCFDLINRRPLKCNYCLRSYKYEFCLKMHIKEAHMNQIVDRKGREVFLRQLQDLTIQMHDRKMKLREINKIRFSAGGISYGKKSGITEPASLTQSPPVLKQMAKRRSTVLRQARRLSVIMRNPYAIN